jgi:hypothetical protein
MDKRGNTAQGLTGFSTNEIIHNNSNLHARQAKRDNTQLHNYSTSKMTNQKSLAAR